MKNAITAKYMWDYNRDNSLYEPEYFGVMLAMCGDQIFSDTRIDLTPVREGGICFYDVTVTGTNPEHIILFRKTLWRFETPAFREYDLREIMNHFEENFETHAKSINTYYKYA